MSTHERWKLWRQRGVVDEERYEAEGTHISGRLPATIAGQIAPFQVNGTHR